MEHLDIADSYRFIGNEFLMWLWFKTDCLDGLLPIAGHGDVEVFFDDHLRLDAYLTDAERSDFKGGSPAYAPEAKTALQQGKRVSKGKIRINKDGREWVFSITGETLDLSGIKIPAVLAKEEDEQFYERIYLIEELEELIETLYQEFVKIRVSSAWSDICLPAMREWTKRDGKSSPKDYPKELRAFEKSEPKLALKKSSVGYYVATEDDDPDTDSGEPKISAESNLDSLPTEG